MIKIVKDENGSWCVGTNGIGGYLLYWAIQIAIAAPLAYLLVKWTTSE
jgi:hypothetical protein